MEETNRAFGVTDPSLALGLSDINFFSSAIPFINVFKQIGDFAPTDGGFTLQFTDENGVEQNLDYTELFHAGFLDENGYLTRIPEGARSIISLFNDFPVEAATGGRYVFLHEGDGDFEFFGANVIESESTEGRIVLELIDGVAFGLIINSVDEDDHLREIALVREEHEAIFEAGAIFNPDFIEEISDFRSIRFLDWLSTNNSTITNFDDIATIDSAFYGIPGASSREVEIAGNFPDLIDAAELASLPRGFVTPVFLDPETRLPLRDSVTNELLLSPTGPAADVASFGTGVPLEVMVALANQIGADPWFNIPHFATDEFVREFAEFIRDNLDPELNVTIEYSNEVWNASFDQFHFANEQGLALFEERRALGDNFGDQFGAFPARAYYGYRSAEILSIFDEVFGDDAERVQGVLGTQTVNEFGTIETISGAEYYLEINEPGRSLEDLVDAVGITGYFGDNIVENSALGESLIRLLATSRDAFANGQTSSEFELFNVQLANFYRDGTLFEGADPILEGIRNFNLDQFREFINNQLSIINGNDFFGNPTRTAYDFDLIQYEGGPHILPVANDPDLFAAITQFNRSAELGQVQLEAFALFRELGGTLANDFGGVGVQRFAATFGTIAFLGDTNDFADDVFDFNANGAAQFGSVEEGRSSTAFLQGLTDFGSQGNDTLFGSREIDFISGGFGSDSIDSGNGDDGINGEEGNDILRAGNGNDTILGGSGNDTAFGGFGDDSIVGGDGDDEIRSGANLDTVFGGAGNDRIISQRGADLLNGEEGDDFLSGSTGFDTINGGIGNDTIDGGIGADVITGGNGNDVISAASNNDTVDGGAGNDRINAGSGFDFVNAGSGADFVNGGGGFDTINGGSGNDLILGDIGNDVLNGNTGNDTINGGSGNDAIAGNAGADVLNGSFGNDFLSGGGGGDTFVFVFQFGQDVIADFNFGIASEFIDLSRAFGISSFSDLVNNHLSQNGNGDAVITTGNNSITLLNVGVDDLSASDFIF